MYLARYVVSDDGGMEIEVFLVIRDPNSFSFTDSVLQNDD